MVCVRVAFHENDGNTKNDENDEDNSDSYKQGVECWIRGNHGNHGKPWKSRVQTTGSPNHGLRNTRFLRTLAGQKFKQNFAIFLGKMTRILKKEEFMNSLQTAIFPILLLLALRVDLPVHVCLIQKFESCRKNVQNLCRHILGSSPQILCENCAAQILHNLCTFFGAPAHVSHKFSGTSRNYPAYKFCTIFSDMWHVLKICLCTSK